MQFVKNSTILASLLCLSACGSDDACDRPLPYVNSKAGETLVIPTGLTPPSEKSQQTIPDVADNRRARSNPCSSGPPELVIAKAVDIPDAPEPPSTAPVPGLEATPLTVGPGFDSDSVEETLNEWISSWRTADSPRYLSFYAQDFRGSQEVSDRDAWLQRRYELLEMTGEADISIRDVVIEDLPAGRKIARLIQEFRNGDDVHSVIKVLEMVREGNGWRIRREQVVQVL